jgi:cytochrome c oxidase subunit 4
MSNEHSSHHVAPVGHYVGVFLFLMVMTGVTVAAAFVDMGMLNTPVALGIAICKATAVIWIFMEIRHSHQLTRLTVITGIFFFAILLIFVFGDFGGRGMVTKEEGWRNDGPHTVGSTDHPPAAQIVDPNAPAAPAAKH